MQDYVFEYQGDSFRVPKNKIFECLYEIGEIESVATIGEVFTSNNFMKAAKIFCVLGSYAKQSFDPIEVTKNWLHTKGAAIEIYTAVGNIVALLNPPEEYHPPEDDKAGKQQAETP